MHPSSFISFSWACRGASTMSRGTGNCPGWGSLGEQPGYLDDHIFVTRAELFDHYHPILSKLLSALPCDHWPMQPVIFQVMISWIVKCPQLKIWQQNNTLWSSQSKRLCPLIGQSEQKIFFVAIYRYLITITSRLVCRSVRRLAQNS